MSTNPANDEKQTLSSRFYRGEYGQLLAATIDSLSFDAGILNHENLEFVVGALSFSGRVEEAEILFSQHEKNLSQKQKIACQFYLGVTRCRKLSFQKARKLFAKNARTLRSAGQCEQSRFFIFQGLAFYRYTYGYLRQALAYSEKAYAAAFAAQFPYGRVLAQELRGHALAGTGAIRQGITALRQAAEWAQTMGRGTVVQSIESGISYYQAIYGISKNPVQQLEQMIAALGADDTYARTFLELELARQLQMTGQLKASKKVLDSACQQAYAFSNIRLEAMLNFRLACYQAAGGEISQALNLLKNTQKRLHPDIDKLLEVRVLGLEVALLKRLGMDVHNEDSHLARLTRRTGQIIARRVLERRKDSDFTHGEIQPGQDPLGDLIDRVSLLGSAAVPDVIESGYLGLLHQCTQIDGQSQYLVFGLEGQSLTIFDRGEVVHLPDGISNLQRKLVNLLAEGDCSKEELTKALWGQKYNPIRHDPLIYTLVSKLRRILGERSKWIEISEAGYRLEERIKIRNLERSRIEPKNESEEHPTEKRPETADLARWQSILNFRQLEIVKNFSQGESLDVTKYGQLFSVSPVTASRDLAHLEKLGICKRIGKARATKYVIQRH